jgi:mannose-6-phosphate isomerase
VHLRKHPEFAACISTEAQLAVFTAGPRDSKAQKLALHKVFESFMVWSSVPSYAFSRRRRASSP